MLRKEMFKLLKPKAPKRFSRRAPQSKRVQSRVKFKLNRKMKLQMLTRLSKNNSLKKKLSLLNSNSLTLPQLPSQASLSINSNNNLTRLVLLNLFHNNSRLCNSRPSLVRIYCNSHLFNLCKLIIRQVEL